MWYPLQCLWALNVLWQQKTIAWPDRLRLWKKSFNLFLCFLAFTDARRPKEQVGAAMLCAVLSAIYDYETDWSRIGDLAESIYLRLLSDHVPDPVVREGASRLFEQDWKGVLSEHGLERGSIALAFYHAVIGSAWLRAYNAEELAQFGRSLQMIDDAIDLERDRASGDTNCLLTEQAAQYSRELRAFLDGPFFRALERNAPIYRLLRARCLQVLNALSERPSDRARAGVILRRIYGEMLRRDPEKYGDWLKKLDAGRTFLRGTSFALRDPYFKRAAARLELVDLIYGFCRDADDISDGDAPVPEGWSSASGYIAHLLRYLQVRGPAMDEREFLLGYLLDLGDRLGIDVRSRIGLILGSLHFDAERRESVTLVRVPRARLEDNYYLLDERGTIELCLLVLGESLESFSDIALLGMATRVMFTLRDLREDMRKGLCNVPLEDFEAFGMYVPDIHSEEDLERWYNTPEVRAWRAHEARRGLELFRRYLLVRDDLKIHHFTLAILEFLYERPVQAGLESTLQAAA